MNKSYCTGFAGNLQNFMRSCLCTEMQWVTLQQSQNRADK